MTHRYFPLFIDSKDTKVLVIGGGTIAKRRITTLLQFEFDVTVLSPDVTDTIRSMAGKGRVQWIPESFPAEHIQPDPSGDKAFSAADLSSYSLVLACTDSSEVNHRVGELAEAAGVYYNVCDDRTFSNVWFPAVALNEDLTVGIVGNGEDHGFVRRAAAKIRELIGCHI